MSLVGLGLLLKEIPVLMIAVKILGGLYLIYIGVLIVRSSLKARTSPSPASTPATEKNQNAFLLGFLTGTTNPKVVIFYGSLLAVVIGQDSSITTKMAMAPFCGMVCFLWYGFVAVALSVPRLRERYQKWGAVIDRVSGTILCLFGIALILSGTS